MKVQIVHYSCLFFIIVAQNVCHFFSLLFSLQKRIKKQPSMSPIIVTEVSLIIVTESFVNRYAHEYFALTFNN